MTRCVFFDRDGIVNAAPETRYVGCWEDFRLLPGFIAALLVARAHGYEAVVVTNQRGIATGAVAGADVEALHRRLLAVLEEEYGLPLLDLLCCPHDRGQCDCRKPAPGMLIEAARRHGLDLAHSWMIGDKESDVAAGRAAGCHTVRVASGVSDSAADHTLATIDELAAFLDRTLAARRT